LNEKILGMVVSSGDSKSKNKAKEKLKKYEQEMIKGTDGKYYKYPSEEFAPERKTLPKRLQKKLNRRMINGYR